MDARCSGIGMKDRAKRYMVYGINAKRTRVGIERRRETFPARILKALRHTGQIDCAYQEGIDK